MGRARSRKALFYALVLTSVFVVFSSTFIQTCQALTGSYGRPYQGYLQDGVVFPNEFPGYHLRDENRSYTTPEVVGALLDAIEGVRAQFPDTCDLFLGDFSAAGGGSAIHHRSHQNGRDVDIGMYAKGNRPLNTFMPMNQENLDTAKTWRLIEGLIASQRVQYIFLDRSVQRVLYEYAASRGYDSAYLSRIFGNVRGALIQHVRNHVDHMHVRFFTPWSTLAAHIGSDESDKKAVIEAAQQSYLPKKVNYYVSGSEKGLDELACNFGVTTSDLCRWNHINSSCVLTPGRCLIYYKRSFESEPVLLARSLQPGFIAQAPAVRTASLQLESESSTIIDATSSADAAPKEVKKSEHSQPEVKTSSTLAFKTYKARRGDTLERIARRNKLDVKLLCQLNGITKSTHLRVGQKVKTGAVRIASVESATVTDGSEDADQELAESDSKAGINARGKETSSSICFASDSKKPNSPTAAYYIVNHGGTLKEISKKTGISLSSLCQLNGLSRNASLKPGQRIKLTQANLPVRPSLGNASCSIKDVAKKPAVRLNKKSSKTSESKSAHKAAKSASNKSKSGDKSKAAQKNILSNTSAAAKAAHGKGASKQTGKSVKVERATAHEKTTDAKCRSSKVKAKEASKPVKHGALAKM